MEYGKLQGEIAAAGHVGFVAQPAGAVIVGNPFNVASVARIAAGHYQVTLLDGVDKFDCAVIATCDTSPNTIVANNAGVDTDTVKDFLITGAGGTAPGDCGFYFKIVRTNIP